MSPVAIGCMLVSSSAFWVEVCKQRRARIPAAARCAGVDDTPRHRKGGVALEDVASVAHRETMTNGGVAEVAQTPVEVNERGFMKDLAQWTPGAAEYLAMQQGAPRGLDRLTPDHWRVIDYVRSCFYRAGRIPSDGQVCKDLGLSRSELSRLFPGSMVTARRIAGLPGPRRSANGRKLSPSQRVLARDWWARFTE